MSESEFDKIASDYKKMHQKVLGVSGENSEFFAEYKVRDTAVCSQKLDFTDNLSILDFGAGIGESIPYFAKYFNKCRLVSLDVSRKSLTLARSRYANKSSFVCFDGDAIPFNDKSFELIFTACVFHHISPHRHIDLLKEIRRVLKPGGLFIAFEHNPYNFLTVRAVNNCPFDENAVLIAGKEFKYMLTTSGFKEVSLNYRIFFPARLKPLRFIEKIMTWNPLGAQYFVSGQKVD